MEDDIQPDMQPMDTSDFTAAELEAADNFDPNEFFHSSILHTEGQSDIKTDLQVSDSDDEDDFQAVESYPQEDQY